MSQDQQPRFEVRPRPLPICGMDEACQSPARFCVCKDGTIDEYTGSVEIEGQVVTFPVRVQITEPPEWDARAGGRFAAFTFPAQMEVDIRV